MLRNVLLVIITATLWVGGTALSGEIYKWTDEDGNVHYEDRPIGDDVERLKVISSGTNNDTVRASIDARHDRDTARTEARSKRNEDKRATADARAEAAQRNVKCRSPVPACRPTCNHADFTSKTMPVSACISMKTRR